MKQYKNTVQTIQNTVNTSTDNTETPTQLSKHPQITKLTHTHTHPLILQVDMDVNGGHSVVFYKIRTHIRTEPNKTILL